MAESNDFSLEGDMLASRASDDLQDPKDSSNLAPSEHPKKKRRVAKPNPEKKFECKEAGCGKSYSRAEHLYRHQLNHSPKNIFVCNYPECNRWFVRQDLCIRHRERHATSGSQLHKRDSFAQATTATPVDPSLVAASATQLSPDGRNAFYQPTLRMKSPETVHAQPLLFPGSYLPPDNGPTSSDMFPSSRPFNTNLSPSTASAESRFLPVTPQPDLVRGTPSVDRANDTGSTPFSPEHKPGSSRAPPLRTQSSSNTNPSIDRESHTIYPTNTLRNSTASSIPQPSSTSRHRMPAPIPQNHNMSTQPQADFRSRRTNSNDIYSPTNVTIKADMDSELYPTTFSDLEFTASSDLRLMPQQNDPLGYASVNASSGLDPNAAFNYPAYEGGDKYPHNWFEVQMFTDWLLGPPNPNPSELPYSGYEYQYDEGLLTQMAPEFSKSPSSSNIFQTPSISIQHPMKVTSVLSPPDNDSIPPDEDFIMSETKRKQLLDMIRTEFVEKPDDPVMTKDELFMGDVDGDKHMLSLDMMHIYIGSYWYHQHAQLPILHRPTFSPNNTNSLLLLAVIAIGAATLGKVHPTELTDSAADFANFIIWHLRWEIMRVLQCRPPAKLWAFQTLLLIEIYEKMYSTRVLHERAHLFHDFTLTLMRRSNFFQGYTPFDSAEQRTNSLTSKLNASSDQSKGKEPWHLWIEAEAARRAAFGAFVLDSIHATMFGHAAKMAAHEIRLFLPCDEKLWQAMSPTEMGQIQSSLKTNGIKPTMFNEGLRKTLKGEEVQTNAFGRTILMAGLLSISWHVNQGDAQKLSLGRKNNNSHPVGDNWKSLVLWAFDYWKRDFDVALRESTRSAALLPQASQPPRKSPIDDENIFESRTVLHHLAHIASHVDVVECQIFAGASQLLGKSILPKDYNIIRGKIERWARKAAARDAAFYALKFIAQVLVPPPGGIDGIDPMYGHASPILPEAFDENHQYVARDDFLLNRPWVLYTSALVVWCYGYALEGPIVPRPREEDFQTSAQKEKDMRDFLERVGGVEKPDDLEKVKGKNRCLGLLLILEESFASTRWQLTQEASTRLGTACAKLKGDEDDMSQRDIKPELGSRSTSGSIHPGANDRKQRIKTANGSKI